MRSFSSSHLHIRASLSILVGGLLALLGLSGALLIQAGSDLNQPGAHTQAHLEQHLISSTATWLVDDAQNAAATASFVRSLAATRAISADLRQRADDPAALALAERLDALSVAAQDYVARRGSADSLRAAQAAVGAAVSGYDNQPVPEVAGTLRTVTIMLVVAALLLLLLSVLGAWALAPLRALAGALDAVRQGDQRFTLPPHLPAEFQPIARSYAAMVAALGERQRTLADQLRRTSLITQLALELREAIDSGAITERVLRIVGGNLGSARTTLLLGSPGEPVSGAQWIAGQTIGLDSVTVAGLVEHGVEGWALRSHNSTTLADVRKSERWQHTHADAQGSAIVLPIRHSGTTFGCLTVYATEFERFTNHDLLLLEGVAAQAGVALLAAHRYHEERQRRDQAIALLSTSQFLSIERSSADIAALFEDYSRTLFSATHGMLFLRPVGIDLRPLAVGPAPSDMTPLMLTRAAEAAAGACNSRQIVTIGSPSDDSAFTYIALPLIHNSEPLGAGVLIKPAQSAVAFPASLWSLLTIFINTLAAACANRHLVDQMRQHTDQLEGLIERRTEELRRSRDLLRVIFDNLPEGLLLVNGSGEVLAANNAFCRGIIGILPRDTVSKPYSWIWDALSANSELRLEIHGPSEHSNPPLFPGVGEPIAMQIGNWRVLATDMVGQQRWYAVDRIPISGRGLPEQCLERWRDITHQEELQRQLLLHEQLTSLGRLAASIAHEVGNPLQSALGCLELCREDPALSPTVQEYLSLALGELDRMARTMDSLRNLYRPPQITWELLDLNQVIQQVIQFTGRQMARARVEVQATLAPNLPLISGQLDALRQVFLNLLLNAQEAMPRGGTIRLTTRPKPTDRVCEVMIQDTGIGIPAERLEAIFEPFHSGKAQGVGLGLYLSKQIIDQHAGHIQIHSHSGHGTTLIVHLPWSDARPEQMRSAQGEEHAAAGDRPVHPPPYRHEHQDIR